MALVARLLELHLFAHVLALLSEWAAALKALVAAVDSPWAVGG
jgi:hypothetical protein